MKSRIKEFVNKEIVFWCLFLINTVLIISFFLFVSSTLEKKIPILLKVSIFFGSLLFQLLFSKLYWYQKDKKQLLVLLLSILIFQIMFPFGFVAYGIATPWCGYCTLALSLIFVGAFVVIITQHSITIVKDIEIQENSLENKYIFIKIPLILYKQL